MYVTPRPSLDDDPLYAVRLAATGMLAYAAIPLLDPALPQRQSALWKGERRHFYVWPHETHYVWGATAAIMHSLAVALREA